MVQLTNVSLPQIIFKTAAGEWQSIQLQDSVSTTTTPATPVVTTTAAVAPPPASTKRTLAGGRKERTLAKIAPAGGIIALNTSQLSPAAQAVQTISINGVQVQGVPVTITNAGGEFTAPQICSFSSLPAPGIGPFDWVTRFGFTKLGIFKFL